MTDNRTTELRAKLTERGVDWIKPKSAAEFIQTTFLRDGWGIEVLERNIGLCVTATNVFDTPEQVITATLGSGTLTAEQVEKAIHDCSTYASYDGCTYYASGIRLQAIADELNAEMGSGTCEWVLEHSGTLYDKWRCSKCGYLYVESRTDGGATDLDPKFCPCCGRKVVSA